MLLVQLDSMIVFHSLLTGRHCHRHVVAFLQTSVLKKVRILRYDRNAYNIYPKVPK